MVVVTMLLARDAEPPLMKRYESLVVPTREDSAGSGTNCATPECRGTYGDDDDGNGNGMSWRCQNHEEANSAWKLRANHCGIGP